MTQTSPPDRRASPPRTANAAQTLEVLLERSARQHPEPPLAAVEYGEGAHHRRVEYHQPRRLPWPSIGLGVALGLGWIAATWVGCWLALWAADLLGGR